MWSQTSDHTHCFLKLGIIKPAKVAGLATYNRGYVGRARAAYPKYGIRFYYRTYGHTHNLATSSTSSTQIDSSLHPWHGLHTKNTKNTDK